MTRQLAFDFPHRTASGREDFLVAPGNAAAVDWLDRWPDWPGAGLVLYGPPGCGKTHLAQVWERRSGAIRIAPERLAVTAPPELLGAAPGAILDDAAGLPELPLLHLCNWLAERRRHFLIAAREPPARWSIRLPDLRSRLVALPAAAIAPPEDGLLAAIFLKLFADRQLRIGPDLIPFLLGRAERSVDAAQGLVAALDRAGLAEGRKVTISLARLILGLAGEP